MKSYARIIAEDFFGKSDKEWPEEVQKAVEKEEIFLDELKALKDELERLIQEMDYDTIKWVEAHLWRKEAK